jgi:hypothetical protein
MTGSTTGQAAGQAAGQADGDGTATTATASPALSGVRLCPVRPADRSPQQRPLEPVGGDGATNLFAAGAMPRRARPGRLPPR